MLTTSKWLMQPVWKTVGVFFDLRTFRWMTISINWISYVQNYFTLRLYKHWIESINFCKFWFKKLLSILLALIFFVQMTLFMYMKKACFSIFIIWWMLTSFHQVTIKPQCTVSALSVNYQFTFSLLWAFSQCTVSLLSVHCQLTVSALSVHFV